MSKFGDLISGNTTEVKTEVQPTVEPVVDTTPASVEEPVNPCLLYTSPSPRD